MRRFLETLVSMARWDEPWDVEDPDDEVLASLRFLPLGSPTR